MQAQAEKESNKLLINIASYLAKGSNHALKKFDENGQFYIELAT